MVRSSHGQAYLPKISRISLTDPRTMGIACRFFGSVGSGAGLLETEPWGSLVDSLVGVFCT
jgi:hypothetical protein